MPKVLSETMHFQVTKRLRLDIKKLSPNDLVPTSAELEQRYAASHSTIIRALTTLRRDGVIYRPAGQKRYQVSEFSAKPLARITIARPQYPSDSIDNLVRKIVLEGHARHMAFDFKHYENMSVLDMNRVTEDSDALILMPTTEPLPEHIENALAKPNKPVLVITHHLELPNICSVTVDDQQVGKLAAEHLQSLGHKRCMIVLDQTYDSTIEARFNGWRKQMAKHPESKISENLILDADVKPFDDSREVTYEKFKSRLTSQKKLDFTAVFCTSDSGAEAVLRACLETGIRIPEQLSLITYSGKLNQGNYTNPPLTTISADFSSMGSSVCKLLLTKLNNKQPKKPHLLMPPSLTVRQSTIPAT